MRGPRRTLSSRSLQLLCLGQRAQQAAVDFLGAQHQLLSGLAEFLLTDGTSGDAGGPVYSSLPSDHPTADFVEEYVADLKKKAELLNKAITTEDALGIRRICNDIKSVAPELGFAPISELATGAVTALDASMSVPDSLRQIRALVSICLRARCR